MKEERKEKSVLRKGSAVLFLYEHLQDQKSHKLKPLLAEVKKKYGMDPMGRVGNLRRAGAKRKLWAISLDEDAGTIRLIKGSKAVAAAAVTIKKKTAAVASKASKRKALPKGQASDEQHEQAAKNGTGSLGATLTLIRRLLKDDKDWTRNKLIEGMKKQFHIAPQLAEAGIDAGLKNGKLKEQEDGQVVTA